MKRMQSHPILSLQVPNYYDISIGKGKGKGIETVKIQAMWDPKSFHALHPNYRMGNLDTTGSFD